MKLFLRVFDENKDIKQEKQVINKIEAIKDKDKDSKTENYLHICFHDEVPIKACKLEKI